MTLEESISTETYVLSDEEKDEIIHKSVSEMSEELSGYRMNTEMKIAWVSAIVPPGEKFDDAPYSDSHIRIKFLLPSGDEFWESYDYPNLRWPKDNEFRQFLEHMGYYTPENTSDLIGDEVDITFDESIDRWTPEFNQVSQKKVESSSDGINVEKYMADFRLITKFLILGISVLFSIMFILLFRHIGLFVATLLMIFGLTIYNMLDE